MSSQWHAGHVVNAGVDEFVIPTFPQKWGNIRKIADAPGAVQGADVQVLGLSIRPIIGRDARSHSRFAAKP